MSLTKKTGVLEQLGPSQSDASGIRYSYIELGGEMLKSVKTWNGLNGKLSDSLGQSITVYLHRNHLIGFETEDGKVFATQGPSIWTYLYLILLGAVLGLFFLGWIEESWYRGKLDQVLLGFAYWLTPFVLIWYFTPIRAMRLAKTIPNAIVIPR